MKRRSFIRLMAGAVAAVAVGQVPIGAVDQATEATLSVELIHEAILAMESIPRNNVWMMHPDVYAQLVDAL